VSERDLLLWQIRWLIYDRMFQLLYWAVQEPEAFGGWFPELSEMPLAA
jgi:hypothetical protein